MADYGVLLEQVAEAAEREGRVDEAETARRLLEVREQLAESSVVVLK
jgi:hypothetical protein